MLEIGTNQYTTRCNNIFNIYTKITFIICTGDWFDFEAPLPEWAEPIKAKFSDESVKDHPQPPNIDVLATKAAV